MGVSSYLCLLWALLWNSRMTDVIWRWLGKTLTCSLESKAGVSWSPAYSCCCKFLGYSTHLRMQQPCVDWVFFPSTLTPNWDQTGVTTCVRRALWRALACTGTVSQLMARHLQDTADIQGLLELARSTAFLLQEHQDKIPDFSEPVG